MDSYSCYMLSSSCTNGSIVDDMRGMERQVLPSFLWDADDVRHTGSWRQHVFPSTPFFPHENSARCLLQRWQSLYLENWKLWIKYVARDASCQLQMIFLMYWFYPCLPIMPRKCVYGMNVWAGGWLVPQVINIVFLKHSSLSITLLGEWSTHHCLC